MGKLDFVDEKTKELYNYADLFHNHFNDLLRAIKELTRNIKDPEIVNRIIQIGNVIYDTSKEIPKEYANYAKSLTSYIRETRSNLNEAFDKLDILDKEIDNCISNLQ